MFSDCGVCSTATSESYLLPRLGRLANGHCAALAAHSMIVSLVTAHLAGDLASDGLGDGSQWDIVVNLLEVTNDALCWGYCILTESMFFDRIMASLPCLFTVPRIRSLVVIFESLYRLLKTKLREHALVLRDLSSRLRGSGKRSGGDVTNMLRTKKGGLLSEIHGVMSAALGVPPQPNDKFVWDYYDKDGKAGRWEGTAKQFGSSQASVVGY